ncbi:hypothetical protein OK016_16950 [Vibrio chagasii]|nr:hypothetical protein [Vibrio chagasii]
MHYHKVGDQQMHGSKFRQCHQVISQSVELKMGIPRLGNNLSSNECDVLWCGSK